MFRRMSISKIFQRFYREVQGGHGKSGTESDFSIREVSKTRRYDYSNLRQKEKKEARL